MLPHYDPDCPFCPGNEHLTPPEIARLPDGARDGQWDARVIPNRFPALSRDVEPRRFFRRAHHSIDGFGVHEVIVETPDHARVTALMTDAHVAEILRCFRRRYAELSEDPRIAQITIFKNHGVDAGTSLEHPHSQLVAAPVISTQVRSRMQEAIRHYDDFGECVFCVTLKDELEEAARIVLATDHFVALEPYASSTPFCTHIYPRRHMASFGFIQNAEIDDLARVLKEVLAKLYFGLNNPDFNYTIRTAPHEYASVSYYHWYLSVIPRLTRVAGFELGSGTFVNTVLPEAAAEFLRNVALPASVIE
ncbi:MAG: DUF4931 domain-containing protein [Terriglobales bacterium]